MGLPAPRAGYAFGDLYASNPHDRLMLGGQQIPGIVRLTISQEFKHDPRSPNAKAGEALTSSALKSAKGSIEIRIWTPDQHARWDQVRPILWPNREGQTMHALAVEHPVTHTVGVNVIALSRIEGINVEDGITVIRFGWTQLRRGKRQVVKVPTVVDNKYGPSGQGIPGAPPRRTAPVKPSAKGIGP